MSLALNTIFSMILRGEFASGFDEWKSRLHESIEREGEYLEIDSLSSLYLIRSRNCYGAKGLNAAPVSKLEDNG
jgi:hypothetical protein